MTTKIISFNECRTNLSNLWKEAKKKNMRITVTVHGKPAFNIVPIELDEDEYGLFELPQEEVTPEMRHLIEESKKKPRNSFTNI